MPDQTSIVVYAGVQDRCKIQRAEIDEDKSGGPPPNQILCDTCKADAENAAKIMSSFKRTLHMGGYRRATMPDYLQSCPHLTEGAISANANCCE